MKRFILLMAIALTTAFSASSQATLAGEFSSTVHTRFSGEADEEDRYDSPLNPDNIFQMRDVTFDTRLLVKLGAGDENTALDVWIQTDPYRIGELFWLTAGATESPFDDLAAAEGIAYLGDEIPAFRVMRAGITWFPAASLVVKLGRQNMLTGYGYGWNPIDFANPLKDPRDPDGGLAGVDALTLTWYTGSLFSVRAFAIYRGQPLTDGIRYRDLQSGLELTASLPQLEIKATGFYEEDGVSEEDEEDARGEDPYVPAVGIGAKADIFGIGVYTEWAFLQGTRSLKPGEDLELRRENGWTTSALFGAEYTFAFELSLALEYFLNGEGLNSGERDRYLEGLKAAAGSPVFAAPTLEQLSVYRPGFFAEHYLLLHALYPIYDLQTDVSFLSLYSPDSASIMILPELVFRIGGSLNVTVGYSGLLNLDADEESSEIELSPVRHSAHIEARYLF